MENSVEVPQKLKIEPPYDLAILLLGIYANKMKILNQKTNKQTIKAPHSHCSIIYNSQDRYATKVSNNRWLDKEDLEGIMLSEVSQTKRNTIGFYLHVESKKQTKWTNKTRTDS